MSTKNLSIISDTPETGVIASQFDYNNYSDVIENPYEAHIGINLNGLQNGGGFNAIKNPVLTVTPTTPTMPTLPTANNVPDSSYLVNVSATVFDKDGVVPGVNVSVGGVNYKPTDASGNFRLVNISNQETVTFSFVGLETASYPVMQLPKKIVLKESIEKLQEVVIKSKNSSNFWMILAVVGLIYGGYRYSLNSKKQIVKTKI